MERRSNFSCQAFCLSPAPAPQARPTSEEVPPFSCHDDDGVESPIDARPDEAAVPVPGCSSSQPSTEAHGPPPRLWRLGLATVVAVAGFAAAMVHSAHAPMQACFVAAHQDPAYAATLAGQVDVASSSYRLQVSHDGQPVVVATVCLAAHSDRHVTAGVEVRAKEIGGGAYAALVSFDGAGLWRGRVLVAEHGRAAVAVSVLFRVTVSVGPVPSAVPNGLSAHC